MKTAMYLRKSRADEEAEKKSEFETLSRHRSSLLKVAKEQNLNIIEIKEEMVSGESIHYRPKMLELLEEVKLKKYDAVLVMDIDRLGRGNMSDQGLILETFKRSNTKIITPRKVYDLNNEFDEEYSEFEAFMARKELKLITRRMQRGRIKSVEEGRFLASNAPLGYKIEYEGKNRLLVIDEEKKDLIKLIYSMYLEGKGSYKIAHHLNSLGYRTSIGNTFKEKAIRDIIKNKIYAGYVIWNKVERKRGTCKTRDVSEQVEALGLHEAIIDLDDWNKAQSIRTKRIISPVSDNKKLTNTLAGIVSCKSCKCMMSCSTSNYKEGRIKFLRCKQCKDNRGAKVDIVEQEIINYLKAFVDVYADTIPTMSIIENTENEKIINYRRLLVNLEKESLTLASQKEKLHDLLEKGIYDVDTYLDRSKALAAKIYEIKDTIIKIQKDINIESEISISYSRLLPAIRYMLLDYESSEDINYKNALLKTVIANIVYYKTPASRTAKFELDVKFRTDI